MLRDEFIEVLEIIECVFFIRLFIGIKDTSAKSESVEKTTFN